MAQELDFKSAGTVSLETLAAVFTSTFSGYFSPMEMTSETLSQRVRLGQLDLHNSVLAYQDDNLVGMALLGLRGREGWCGGFGINPEFRGRGHAHVLMTEFITRARGCGVTRLSLEVIARNVAAIRVYERAGMRITRDLLILERISSDIETVDHPDGLREADPQTLLQHFGRLHLWKPAWQRDLATLLTADPMKGVYLGEIKQPLAYALIFTRNDGITQVLDLAAAHLFDAQAVVAAISRRWERLRIVNEPEENLFIVPLLANGFEEIDRQHEMACEIA